MLSSSRSSKNQNTMLWDVIRQLDTSLHVYVIVTLLSYWKLARCSVQGIHVFEWRYGYFWPCAQPWCIFPNKRACSQLDQIQLESNLTGVKIIIWDVILCASAVILSNINFCLEHFWIMANDKENHWFVVLQNQANQQELQAMVSTFVAQYTCLTRFPDLCFCQWSKRLISFENPIAGFRCES